MRYKRLRGLLVRVRAVAKRHPLDRSRELFLGKLRGRILLSEVSTDRLVVGRGHLERLERKLDPDRLSDVALARIPRGKELGIVCGVGEDRDALMVLRGRAQKGDATDVDLFDRVGERAVGFGDGVCERVEVADDDGDGGDLLRLKVRLVRRNRPREDA